MTDHAFELTARWVFPVDRPPIEGGHVLVRDAEIAAVGPSRHGGVPLLDLGDAALTPAFVNAHTHLELTCYRGKLAPAPLWDWFVELLKLRREPGAPEAERAAVRQGAAESLAAGVTCIGDISRTAHHAQTLSECDIRAVCFCELISGATLPPATATQLGELVDKLSPLESDKLRLGLSPHAPYTVTADDLTACERLASASRPVTMHTLETPEERDWMLGQGGPIVELLAMHNLPSKDTNWNRGVLSFLKAAGILRRGMLLAHVNYATDDDLDLLAESGAGVVYCPRAHAYYGHESHRWRDMRAAGIPVSIGTDSAAASGTLSILDELRYLHAKHPEVPAQDLLAMGTFAGAAALGWANRIGTLSTGKSAEMVAIPLGEGAVGDPAAALFTGAAPVSHVWHCGRRVGGTGQS